MMILPSPPRLRMNQPPRIGRILTAFGTALTAPVPAHSIVRGYSDPFRQAIKDLHGISIVNLCHRVDVVRDGKLHFETMTFHGEMSEATVLARDAVEAAMAGPV